MPSVTKPVSGARRRSTGRAFIAGLIKLGIISLTVGLIISGMYIQKPGLSMANSYPQVKPNKLPDEVNHIIKPRLFTSNQNIPYCNDQALDFYPPRENVYTAAPLIVFIHGGGWLINNKANEPDQLSRIDPLRDEGFAIASIDYRLMPDFYFPAPVEDTLCSVRFLKEHAADFGIDPNRFGAFGFSAGGYLAAMLGTVPIDSPLNDGNYSTQTSRVQAVVTLAGLLDIKQGLWDSNYRKIARFLHGTEADEANPARYLTVDDPPFLLVHGMQDQFVPPMQDDVFAADLNAAGVQHQQITVNNAEHGLNPNGGVPDPSTESVDKAIREFLKTHVL